MRDSVAGTLSRRWFVGGAEDDGPTIIGAQQSWKRVAELLGEGRTCVIAEERPAVDHLVVQPEEAQSFEITHGGGDHIFFKRHAVGFCIGSEPQFIRMVGINRCDDVDVRSICLKAFYVDLHREPLDRRLAGMETLEDASDWRRLALKRSDSHTLASLPRIKLAHFQFAERHPVEAIAGSGDDRFDGNEVKELRLRLSWLEDTNPDEPARASHASTRCEAEDDAIASSPDQGLVEAARTDPLRGLCGGKVHLSRSGGDRQAKARHDPEHGTQDGLDVQSFIRLFGKFLVMSAACFSRVGTKILSTLNRLNDSANRRYLNHRRMRKTGILSGLPSD